jgi:hypothetical protein
MSKDDRDILELLKAELDFIEKGGYGRSVRTPWLATYGFQDSPSCLCYPEHAHEEACALMQLVPKELQREAVPCHHIPLNEDGETLATLEARGDQQALEEALKRWLRVRIEQIELQRAALSAE